MGVDIDAFVNEGVLIEGERITQREVESAPGMAFTVPIERCADGVHVRYRDPTTGLDILRPASLARRWSVNLPWLRETLLNALGESLIGAKGAHLDDDPVFLGEMQIDGREVAVYFASRMGGERSYRKVDSALRLRPRPQPGIVLTSSFTPLPFAGTNVVIPIEEVLTATDGRPCIDQAALEVAYRAGQLAARGGSSVALQVSPDRQSGMLTVPGLAPWLITGPMRIVVLERLVQAYATGPGHVVTKVLLRDTGCDSLDGLFGADSRWRTYVERVEGTRAWRLRSGPTVSADTEPTGPDDESGVKDSESVDAVDEADATQSLK